MEVLVQPLTDVTKMRRACEMTMHGQTSKVTLKSIYKSEHSPIRLITFWIEMQNIPTFVSVHIVRHKHGVEHFVQSNRDDLWIDKTKQIDRNTPVNHGMYVNAQALINMSRKRLCYKSHQKTVATWMRVKNAVAKVDDDLPQFMVPECVYRNGICPELKVCKPGLDAVMKAYSK